MVLNLHNRRCRNIAISPGTITGAALTCLISLAYMHCPAIAADKQPNCVPHVPVNCRSFSGNVSWYGPGLQGRKTASGEIFDMDKVTAAHRTLPFYVKVLVEDPQTGKSVVVKVNDRGPFVMTRVMDLSREGGRQLGILPKGTTYADCLVLQDQPQPASPQ